MTITGFDEPVSLDPVYTMFWAYHGGFEITLGAYNPLGVTYDGKAVNQIYLGIEFDELLLPEIPANVTTDFFAAYAGNISVTDS